MLQKVADATCVKGWYAAHTGSGFDVVAGCLLRDRSCQALLPQRQSSLLEVRYDHCQYVCQAVLLSVLSGQRPMHAALHADLVG